jgi:hypothetical protein
MEPHREEETNQTPAPQGLPPSGAAPIAPPVLVPDVTANAAFAALAAAAMNNVS